MERVVEAFPSVEFRLIITTGIYYRKTFWQSVVKLLRESSILFAATRAIETYGHRLLGRTVRRAAERRKLPIMTTPDINGAKAVTFARSFAPDLIVSLYTMHIFKQAIISVPKHGTINSHPAILPDYRGLEVFFWAMANGETQIGSSVFFVTERIDHGAVIREETMPLASDYSLSDVYWLITEKAAELMKLAVIDIDEAKVVSRVPEGPGAYYPMPTREAVRAFRRRGRRFFSWTKNRAGSSR
jgi:methionyl-tRNA formyltransferase